MLFSFTSIIFFGKTFILLNSLIVLWNYYFDKIFLPFLVNYCFFFFFRIKCVFFRRGFVGSGFFDFPIIFRWFSIVCAISQHFCDKFQRFYDNCYCYCSRLLQNISRIKSLSTERQLTIINMFLSFIFIIIMLLLLLQKYISAIICHNPVQIKHCLFFPFIEKIKKKTWNIFPSNSSKYQNIKIIAKVHWFHWIFNQN